MGREDLVRSLLVSFIETTGEQIRRITTALEGGELEVVRQEAHSIKGGAMHLAAAPFGEAARVLEETAKAGRIEAAREALASLKEQFERLKNEAAAYDS